MNDKPVSERPQMERALEISIWASAYGAAFVQYVGAGVDADAAATAIADEALARRRETKQGGAD